MHARTDRQQPRRFIDSAGAERIGNEWGFNSFVTLDGARKAARTLARRNSRWHLWRLADGTFDYTASDHPDLPGHPAELVDTLTVP